MLIIFIYRRILLIQEYKLSNLGWRLLKDVALLSYWVDGVSGEDSLPKPPRNVIPYKRIINLRNKMRLIWHNLDRTQVNCFPGTKESYSNRRIVNNIELERVRRENFSHHMDVSGDNL